MSTYRELLEKGIQVLEASGVPDASVDAWELLEYCFGIEKSCYFVCRDDKIENGEQESRFWNLIGRRSGRIPLQHLTGRAWFMGLEFLVTPQVLIPRFDTECLVEETERLLRPGMRVLDLCTGSGCILLSLLSRNPGIQGSGTDISPEALAVAEQNRERLEVAADFICSDLFQKVTGRYDVIVSNPPYIPSREIEDLMPEVRDHDPLLALDGHENGLYFYERIVNQAREYLNPGGWLALEIGSRQGEALRELLEKAGYRNIRIGKDLAGLDRTAWGRQPLAEEKEQAAIR